MMGIARVGIVVAATLAVLAISAAAFVGSGIYDIGADDHHTKIVLAIIEQLRERSIAVRSGVIEVPNLDDSSRIALGAERYAALCIGCHLAPGVTKSDLRRGLYPLLSSAAVARSLDEKTPASTNNAPAPPSAMHLSASRRGEAKFYATRGSPFVGLRRQNLRSDSFIPCLSDRARIGNKRDCRRLFAC